MGHMIHPNLVQCNDGSYYHLLWLFLRLIGALWHLGTLAFHILVIYALVTANAHQDIFTACGKSLWIFLLVHLLLPLAVMLVMLLCLLWGHTSHCISNLVLNDAVLLRLYIGPLLCTVMGYVLLCGLGIYFTMNATNNVACREAMLSSSRLLDSPLLSIIGWVYVVFDILGSITGIGCICVVLFIDGYAS